MRDGTVYKQWIGYRELKPPVKLVLDWNWERFDAQGKGDEGPRERLVTVEFLDRADSAEVVLTHELLPTQETRERMRKGWNCCFDGLERAMYRRFHIATTQWISYGHGGVKSPLRQLQNTL